jgi:hypothetical protein
VFYAYQVINAQPDPTGAMNVQVSATLYRESKALGTSQPVTVNEKNQPDPKRLLVSSDFRLGTHLQPGDYTLQVSAIDKNAPDKRGSATQSIDFEVID